MSNIDVRVEHFNFIHYVAYCDNCDFEQAIFTDETPTPSDVLNSVRKHVRKTRHCVRVEKGSTSVYEPKIQVSTVEKK